MVNANRGSNNNNDDENLSGSPIFYEENNNNTIGRCSSFLFLNVGGQADDDDEKEGLLNGLSPTATDDSHVINIPEGLQHDDQASILSLRSYGSIYTRGDSLVESKCRSIRFQVVVWYVGRPDEVLGQVEMKFRVTIFWNSSEEMDSTIGYGMNNPTNNKVWTMYGRQRAYQRALSEVTEGNSLVYVPPVSILNAVDFEVLGEPEVCLINSDKKLMKWTALYKASLLQDNMNVASFPHDSHDLVLRLAILKHRQRRKRWDKHRWKLDLASRDDTQDTISIPHGTIVSHVKVPGFSYDRKDGGLQFDFHPMEFGNSKHDERDKCLQVKLGVKRESSYYDRNIVPLLAALNLSAICILALDADKFGARGECILAISFVEIGIRMTVDSRLPVVGYQIKIQYILNNLFLALLALVAESSFVYLLWTAQNGYYSQYAGMIDIVASLAGIVHLIIVLSIYYSGSGNFIDRSILSRLSKWLVISRF